MQGWHFSSGGGLAFALVWTMFREGTRHREIDSLSSTKPPFLPNVCESCVVLFAVKTFVFFMTLTPDHCALQEKRGHVFESETDTEVIAKLTKHIYDKHDKMSFREVVENVVQQLVPASFLPRPLSPPIHAGCCFTQRNVMETTVVSSRVRTQRAAAAEANSAKCSIFRAAYAPCVCLGGGEFVPRSSILCQSWTLFWFSNFMEHLETFPNVLLSQTVRQLCLRSKF